MLRTELCTWMPITPGFVFVVPKLRQRPISVIAGYEMMKSSLFGSSEPPRRTFVAGGASIKLRLNEGLRRNWTL